jgi:hypothetical protein
MGDAPISSVKQRCDTKEQHKMVRLIAFAALISGLGATIQTAYSTPAHPVVAFAISDQIPLGNSLILLATGGYDVQPEQRPSYLSC